MRRLKLRGEVLRTLGELELAHVAGGVDTGHSQCCATLYEGCQTFNFCPFNSDRTTCACTAP